MNIGLAIDKKNGVESEVVGTGTSGSASTHTRCMNSQTQSGKDVFGGEYKIRKAQNTWNSWGTALKPAFEPIIVARKPFKGSLVDNIIKNGVGGINIDECRVGNEHFEIKDGTYDNNKNQSCFGNIKRTPKEYNGRFPANVILTYDDTDFEEVCGGFPNTKSTKTNSKLLDIRGNNYNKSSKTLDISYERGLNDSVSAARYFYCAKASKRDRDEGLNNFEISKVNDGRKTPIDNAFQRGETLRKNTHPTVKTTTLMQYLVRLVTPNGGTILDPFMGSGSTGKAVMYENNDNNKNYKFIGIELTEEYLPIANARIKYAMNNKTKEEEKEEEQYSLEVE